MAKRRVDITGERYGRLTVIKEVESNKYHRRWLCQCDCGNETVAYMNSLRNGNTQSCGCLQKERAHEANISNLAGRKFGKLTVLEIDQTKKNNRVYWKCHCDCGNSVSVATHRLVNEETNSCGCLRVEQGKSVQIYNQTQLTYEGVFTPLLRSKIRTDNQTGVKGVYPVQRKNGIKYAARIGIKKKEIYLGTYDTIEEAAMARKRGEQFYHEPYLPEQNGVSED